MDLASPSVDSGDDDDGLSFIDVDDRERAAALDRPSEIISQGHAEKHSSALLTGVLRSNPLVALVGRMTGSNNPNGNSPKPQQGPSTLNVQSGGHQQQRDHAASNIQTVAEPGEPVNYQGLDSAVPVVDDDDDDDDGNGDPKVQTTNIAQRAGNGISDGGLALFYGADLHPAQSEDSDDETQRPAAPQNTTPAPVQQVAEGPAVLNDADVVADSDDDIHARVGEARRRQVSFAPIPTFVFKNHIGLEGGTKNGVQAVTTSNRRFDFKDQDMVPHDEDTDNEMVDLYAQDKPVLALRDDDMVVDSEDEVDRRGEPMSVDPGPAVTAPTTIELPVPPEIPPNAPSWIRPFYEYLGQTTDAMGAMARGNTQLWTQLAQMKTVPTTSRAIPDDQPKSHKKISLAKQQREHGHVKLARAIREVAATLLKVDALNKRDRRWVVDPPANVSEPLKTDFHFRWTEPVSSHFNKKAIRIVLEELMEKHPNLYRAHIRIAERKVKEHFIGLHRQTRRARNREFNKILYLRKRSKHQRKYNLFQRRVKICSILPAFAPHLPLYHTLGPGGMSSDEEFQEPGRAGKSYRVTVKPWLSEGMRNLNAAIDMAIMAYAKEIFTRGTLPRRRVRTADISINEDVVVGLPAPVYNLDWLNARTQEQRAALEISEMTYNFA